VHKHQSVGSRLVTVAAGVIGIMLLAAAPVAADTGPTGDKSYSQTGFTAQAYPTTCSEDGDILTCTDVGFWAFTGKLKDGTSQLSHLNQLCVELGTRSFNSATGEDVGQPVFERGCAVDVPNGAIQIDSKLGSATVSATTLTIEQLDCSSKDVDCITVSSRDVSITGSWIGTGAVSSNADRSHGDDGLCRYSESFKGSGRSASFTGTIGDESFSSDDVAFLSSGRETFRSRCDEG
jgi:hypothetical protein